MAKKYAFAAGRCHQCPQLAICDKQLSDGAEGGLVALHMAKRQLPAHDEGDLLAGASRSGGPLGVLGVFLGGSSRESLWPGVDPKSPGFEKVIFGRCELKRAPNWNWDFFTGLGITTLSLTCLVDSQNEDIPRNG